MRFHRYLLLVILLSLSVPAYADLLTFSSSSAFIATAPGLPVETFESGLVDAVCTGPLSRGATSACFPAGGLLPGVVYSATGDPSMIVTGPALPIGNTSNVLGPSSENSTFSLGFTGVNDVRQGKYIEVDLAEADEGRAREQVERICKELLANTVIENYAYELAR